MESKSNPENGIKRLMNTFYTHGKLQRFNKGSFVFMKDDIPAGSYLIQSGLLKIFQSTDRGQNITFFIRKEGDAFGLAEMILEREHPCYAQCLQDCEIWVLDSDIIKEKMEKDFELTKSIMYMMSDRLLFHQDTVELLASKSVSERLAWFLQQICTPLDDEKLYTNMEFTHEEISNIIGSSRQTVTEILAKWKKQKKIDYDRKQIIILDKQLFD